MLAHSRPPMRIQPIATIPMARLDTHPVAGKAPAPHVQLAAENARPPASPCERRLPYPIMKLGELLEEWVRFRIQSSAFAARQSRSR